MSRAAAFILGLALLGSAPPKRWDPAELGSLKKRASELNRRLEDPELAPAGREELSRQRESALRRLHAIGEENARDALAQLEVGRGFAELGAPERGVPFVERAILIAEAGADRGLKAKALSAAASVQFEAGRYETAAKRAKAALELDPKDEEARAVYMSAKGRSAGGSGGGKSAAGAAAYGGSSAPPPAAGAQAARTGAGTRVPLSSPGRLQADKALAEARRLAGLDPGRALKAYDAAVAAHFKSAALRLERADARLAAGDARGALSDADAAIELGGGAAALAARARARRALGHDSSEIADDFEKAAGLDPAYAPSYEEFVRSVAAARVREPEPGARKARARGLAGVELRSLLGAAVGGLLLILFGFLLLKRRRR